MDANQVTFAVGRPAIAGRMPLETRKPRTAPALFPPRRDYASVSIKDLLDARRENRVRLSRLPNVLGTAIGRYLINKKDWYATHPPDVHRPDDVPLIDEPRTLANSIVRPWSWPAVLVFVKQWQHRESLGENAVPRALYLPDGRVVPTCVIQATPDESLPPPVIGPFHNSEMIGGGYACFRKHQGEEASGSLACLVRKGGSYYTLTNRHVAGGDGEVVEAFIRSGKSRIGTTSNIAVDRKCFSSIFPGWNDDQTLLTLDAGLIRIDDIADWTSQAFGIGEIGELFDASDTTVTLDLIGCPVRAFGGYSGVCEGEIKALFFSYASSGGLSYATDVLIGPRALNQSPETGQIVHPFTHPGDSGTLWFYDPPSGNNLSAEEKNDTTRDIPEYGARARRLRPIVMQWGGQRVRLSDGSDSAYAIGSFISSICQSLDVEVVRDWSTGHDEYWGKIGHFSIGWKACDRLSGKLSDLMKANQIRIGYDDVTISGGSQFKVGRQGFVPLADVPDYVWVIAKGTHPNESIQHFADIDIYDIDGGDSLLDRCFANPNVVAASKWKEYFDGFAAKGVGPEEGTLPFRVWQIWEAMRQYANEKDVAHFVAAAGVLAHYVGDASQPLHCSYLHHGRPPMVKLGGREYPVPRDSEAFSEFKTSAPAKIHSIYEEGMLEVDTAEALAEVDTALADGDDPAITIEDGHDAAVQIIGLMKASQRRLKPEDIIDADDPTLGPTKRAAALWADPKIKKGTVESLADSVRLLSALWSAAWTKGNGDDIANAEIRQFDEDELMKIYRQERDFVPSMTLNEMVSGGQFEPK